MGDLNRPFFYFGNSISWSEICRSRIEPIPMKNKLLLLLLMLFSTVAYSQVSGDFKYSVGTRGYSYMQMPKVFNQSKDTYLDTYFNSYMIKFVDNLFSYRLSGSYLNKDFQFNNNCDKCELAVGSMKDLSFKVGFEKNFNYTVIQPYIAFDLGYRSNKFEGVSKNNNPELIATDADVPSSSLIGTKEGVTLSPVFGIKVNPIKEASIFIESSLDLFYAYERQENVTQDVSNTRTISKFRKTDYLINPISIGVLIHFGNTN